MIITPKPNKIPQINKVELFYVDDKKGSTFSFFEKLRARAYCVNMFNKEVVFTLWEDDAKGGGHSISNMFIEQLPPKKVDKNGIATAEFSLTQGLMKKAMRGEHDSQMEFYVTVEYYTAKKHASENVEVIYDPFPRLKNPPSPPPPAKAKGKSKKDEKGIGDKTKDGKEVRDHAEIGGTITKDKEPTVEISKGVSLAQVEQPNVGKKPTETCFCKQYDLIWGGHPNVNCEFRKKVVEICKDLWGEENKIKMANNLMAVFRWESGNTFKSDVPNQANSGGTGLIQFIPSTAKDLLGREITIETVKNYFGKKFNKKTKQKEDWYLTRVKEFADMKGVDQLEYVKKYFEPLRNKDVEFVDFYLQVLFPASSQLPEHVVFADKLSKLDRVTESEKLKQKRINAYEKNKGLDINADGKVTKSEIKTKVQIYITEGFANKEKDFECGSNEKTKEKQETKTNCKSDCICNLETLLITDGFINNSQIKKNRVISLEQAKFADSKKISGIILHRTVTKTTQATINAFSNKRDGVYYGTHFIVGKSGDITQTAHLDYKTNHAKGWNSKSIGIEVVGMPIDKNGTPTIKDKDIVGWEDLTETQAKSVACLSKALLKYYALAFEDLHCHEDVASKTKGEGEYVLKAIEPYFK